MGLRPDSDDDCIQEVAGVEEEDGDGGLAPLAQHPPAAEPLIPVRRKRKRPALSAQTWMVGSEDEERSLRRDERRAGRGLGGAVASVSDATETRQTVSVCRAGRGGVDYSPIPL